MSAKTIRVGAYTLDPAVAELLGGFQPLALNDEQIKAVRAATSRTYWVRDCNMGLHKGALFLGRGNLPDAPAGHDILTHFFATPSGTTVSVIARQGPNGYLYPFKGAWPGEPLIQTGTHTIDEMLVYHNAILRALWWIAMLGCVSAVICAAWIAYQALAAGFGPDNLWTGAIVRMGNLRAVVAIAALTLAAASTPDAYLILLSGGCAALLMAFALSLQSLALRWDREDESELRPEGVAGKIVACVLLWVVFCGFFVIVAGIMTSLVEWRATREWVRTPCTVSRAWPQPAPGANGVCADVAARYEYTVDGRQYVGQQYAPEYPPAIRIFPGIELAGSIAGTIKPGEHVCRVNPADPAQAVLSRIPNGPAFGHGLQWVLTLLLPVLLVAVVISEKALRGKGTAQWIYNLTGVGIMCVIPCAALLHLILAGQASFLRFLVTFAITLPFLLGWGAGIAYAGINAYRKVRALRPKETQEPQQPEPAKRRRKKKDVM